MSERTTSTAWHVLKYAQSYAKSDQMTMFTNPVIRVVLDSKKSQDGRQLESMRLRVLWEDPNRVNVQPYVYEDLDLLSFSVPTTFNESLPLKAMYRDATVGIRYQHPREPEPGKPPGTRRFQVTFPNAQEASQFIAHIEYVCVCKLSPQPPARPINNNNTLTTNVIAPRPIPAASTIATATTRQPPLIIPKCPHNPIVTSDELIAAEVTPLTDQIMPSSLPPSSCASEPIIPSSSHSATATRIGGAQQPRAKEFIQGLRKDRSIYELSDEDLEKAIGEAIRDPGFLSLMERLDKMWKVKGLVGV